MKVLTENHEEINLKDLTEDADDVNLGEREKERYDYVDLDLGKDEEHEAAEEEDDENLLFDDLDTIAPAADDEDFKSSDLFDDYDDLDDLDSDDDI